MESNTYYSRNRELLKQKALDYYYANKDKAQAYGKKYREENPDKVKLAVAKSSKAWRRANVETNRVLIAQFRANGCKLCTESHPICLQAHHLDPSTKEKSVAALMQCKPDRLIEELAKCVCLCANCHFKVHAGILNLEK